ncbi:MAG: hypothetical protein Q8K60_02760 [Parachlamydiaceae bacterium]|nr:hypothetical protein [Parachlamydiaceae bacterium]
MTDFNINRTDGMNQGINPVEGAGGVKPVQGISGEAKTSNELYTEYMTVIIDLYNKSEPYTQEDYEALQEAMDGLEALLLKDPPPEDLTPEMIYNTQIMLYILRESGITTSTDPEDPIAAMNAWKNQTMTVESWTTGGTVSVQEFMDSALDLTGITHSATWIIKHLSYDQVTETYLEELKRLTELLELTNEVLAALTGLYNILNYMETADVPPFVFPPKSYADMPQDEGFYILLAALDLNTTEEDLVVNGVVYEDMTLSDMLTSAYFQDRAAAEKLVEETGCTLEEAMAQQHQSSDVFNAIMVEWGDENGIAEACLEAFFVDYGELVNETIPTEQLEEIWGQLEATMNELADLLEQIDPTGQVRVEDSTSLAYYLDQILQDFNEVPQDYSDDGKALYWLTMATDEQSQSMTKFNIDMAISTAQSLASEQKIDMQMQMMVAKSILSCLDETWDTLMESQSSINRQIS